jgi:hypothetical protein
MPKPPCPHERTIGPLQTPPMPTFDYYLGCRHFIYIGLAFSDFTALRRHIKQEKKIDAQSKQ